MLRCPAPSARPRACGGHGEAVAGGGQSSGGQVDPGIHLAVAVASCKPWVGRRGPSLGGQSHIPQAGASRPWGAGCGAGLELLQRKMPASLCSSPARAMQC